MLASVLYRPRGQVVKEDVAADKAAQVVPDVFRVAADPRCFSQAMRIP